MLFNLYQISSEDAASVFVINADIASLLINFDQARVRGRRVEGSNLIKFLVSESASVSGALASVSGASASES